MRTQFILVIQSIFSLLGGGLIAFSVGQSAAVQGSMIVVGALLTLGSLSWGWWKLSRLGTRIAQWQPGAAKNESTGFADIDVSIRDALGGAGGSNPTAAGTDANELNEVKDILDKVDRRKSALDREGRPLTSGARLIGILKGYGNNLNSNIQQTTSCGRELRRAIEEIVDSSEVQSDLMSRTTSAVEEMSAHIMSVCDNADQALEASRAMKSTADNGLEKFRSLSGELKRIRKYVMARERKMQQLGQHTKEIETIVQTIGSLSSRTDLLALNASIESVRAGEHGRGFAVVAEEVRALAEQSAQAVLDINRRLEMIQLETSQTAASGDEDQMQSVMQRVNETLESLEGICESANNSEHGIGDISEFSGKQLRLAQEIVEALEESTDSTQKNRSRAEGAHWTAKSLGEAGEHLNSSLDLFLLTGAIDATQETNETAAY